MQLAFPEKRETTKWLYPGKVVTVAPEIHMAIAYDQVDGEYKPRFKFWYQGKRVKDYHLDNNHQIDMRISCRRIITLLVTTHHELTGKPIKSLLEIAHVPYSWEQ